MWRRPTRSAWRLCSRSGCSAAGDAPLLVFDRTLAWIAPERVRSDLDLLRGAARSDDAAALLEQVGARPRELLMDLASIDEGFDEWLAQERVRRADERRGLMLSVGEAVLATGDRDGARQIFLELEQALLADLQAAPSDETGALHRALMAAPAELRTAPARDAAPAVPIAVRVGRSCRARNDRVDAARGAGP